MLELALVGEQHGCVTIQPNGMCDIVERYLLLVIEWVDEENSVAERAGMGWMVMQTDCRLLVGGGTSVEGDYAKMNSGMRDCSYDVFVGGFGYEGLTLTRTPFESKRGLGKKKS